jgi:hypothetical protein
MEASNFPLTTSLGDIDLLGEIAGRANLERLIHVKRAAGRQAILEERETSY